MTEQRLAESVVAHMLERDAFSTWLGLELLEVSPGRAVLKMRVRPDMLNSFQCCHGGITFSLADSALALASNSRGRMAVSVENSLAYPASVRCDDVLIATAEEESLRDKLAFYRVTVTRDGETVGIFRGAVYRTSRQWRKILHPVEESAPAS